MSFTGVVGCASTNMEPPEATSAGMRESDVRAALDRPEDVEPSVESWTFETTPGRIIRTPHYRIFTTETDAMLLSRMPRFLELALQHYRSGLGPLPSPELRLDTYLMANRPQWTRLTQHLMGNQAGPYLRIRRGGFATRGVAAFYNIGPFDTLAIAAHEGWHQYTQRTFRNPLPIWLEEGVATFMEGHRWAGSEPVFLPWANVERFDHLRATVASDSLIPLEQLLQIRPEQQLGRADEDPLDFYAQVWALVHFLNEGDNARHRAALRQLLSDAAEGRIERVLAMRLGPQAARSTIVRRIGPEVFLAYFDEDLDRAAERYETFVRSIVATGARDRIVAGRSPFDSEPSRRR